MLEEVDVSAFLRLFRGRRDWIAQQGDDYYYPVPYTLDSYLVNRHIRGDVTLGMYVLTEESMCNLICVDVDIPKGDLQSVDFLDRNAKYARLSDQFHRTRHALLHQCGIPTESVLFEDTGGRGYHLWIFAASEISGHAALTFGKALKSSLDFDVEVFPKQSHLDQNRK